MEGNKWKYLLFFTFFCIGAERYIVFAAFVALNILIIMSLVAIPFAVDINKVKSIFGSKDPDPLEKIKSNYR